MDRTGTRIPRSIQPVLNTIPMGHSGKERNGPTPHRKRREDDNRWGLSSRYSTRKMWNRRPDGIVMRIPTKDKQGEFVILEFKRMSDVTEKYLSG